MAVSHKMIKTKGRLSNARIGFKTLVRALKHRNYRIFFAGQTVSLTGSWMQEVAVGWLVYRLTGSAFLLGLVSFSGQIPYLVLTPLAGVLTDRYNRHRMLMVSQTLAMLQAFALAFLAFGGMIRIWHLVFLSLFQGIVDSFQMPARQSFLVEIVDKREDLPNAIALNSFMFNIARFFGPCLAGLLLAVTGEGVCFLANGLSFLAVVMALLLMDLPARKIPHPRRRLWHEMREGFSYAFGFPPIRMILFIVALMAVMGRPYAVLAPVYAKEILHGGPHTLGFLLSGAGAGALCGALFMASRTSVIGLGRLIAGASAVFGAGLVGLAFSRTEWLSMLMMFLVGFGMIVQTTSCSTVLQTIVDDDKRGRLMSIYTTAFMGFIPFGSLGSGALASRVGVPKTMVIGGLLCLFGAFLFARKLPALKASIRPVYASRGLIPIAGGVSG